MYEEVEGNSSHTPARNTQRVDHGGVTVGTNYRVWVEHAFILVQTENHPRQILEVYLVHDSAPRWHDGHILEALGPPLQEAKSFLISLELDLLIFRQCVCGTRHIHLYAVALEAVEEELKVIEGLHRDQEYIGEGARDDRREQTRGGHSKCAPVQALEVLRREEDEAQHPPRRGGGGVGFQRCHWHGGKRGPWQGPAPADSGSVGARKEKTRGYQIQQSLWNRTAQKYSQRELSKRHC